MTDLMNAMMDEDEFLEHYGVPGMKWGRRKSDRTNPSHVSADAARVKKIEARLKKNGPSNLSNDDIAKLNKRAQLMSEYKKNNPSKLQKGHKATKEALAIVGTATAVVALGIKAAKSPVVQKGAKIVADVLKNMAQSSSGPAYGGEYVKVVKAITG